MNIVICAGREIEFGWCSSLRSLTKAERLVVQELKLRRWTEVDLDSRRKGDPEKIEFAARLRRDTLMTLKWIARRLHMGSWTHVSNCLARHRNQSKD
jgi:hypothetical protein